jgi:hypothetical protein
LKRWERWTFNALSFTVAITGLAYFWMKYLMTDDDPFVVVNHPWQAPLLALHVIASPAFILVFGIVFNSHVMKKLKTPRLPNRKSGLVSLVTFAIMVFSGYLLQVASSEATLRGLIVLHVASGTVFAVVYAVHLVISARLGERRRDTAIREVA